MIKFMHHQNISSFHELEPYAWWPRTQALVFAWNKTAPALPAPTRRCDISAPGQWQPFPGQCTAPLCEGAVDTCMLNTTFAAASGMHHVFAPFACHIRYFTKAAAQQCVVKAKPLLVGDSRMNLLQAHAAEWLGNGSTSSIDLNKPHLYFGLPMLLLEDVKATITQALKQGRPVLINSLLHDLINYYEDADIVRAFDPEACGNCKNTTVQCKCETKVRAVQKFAKNLEEVAKLLEAARQAGAPGHAFWVSQHRRPPTANKTLHHVFNGGVLWQLHDLLYAAEDQAAEVLARAGARHVDLRHHMISAPAHWWDDDLHHFSDSLFKHTSLQVMLNAICPG
jgi:hypothetical protein